MYPLHPKLSLQICLVSKYLIVCFVSNKHYKLKTWLRVQSQNEIKVKLMQFTQNQLIFGINHLHLYIVFAFKYISLITIPTFYSKYLKSNISCHCYLYRHFQHLNKSDIVNLKVLMKRCRINLLQLLAIN